MKKKKVNWFKIIALALTAIEVYIILSLDKTTLKTNLNLWRMYIACYAFVFINLIYIVTKTKKC